MAGIVMRGWKTLASGVMLAKADDPVITDGANSDRTPITGSSAFADDDDG
jgi:hypothetical protein